jgi:hypothetical protein
LFFSLALDDDDHEIPFVSETTRSRESKKAGSYASSTWL